MTFPTTSILDDFNRADEGPPPSASWVNGYYAGYSNYKLQVISNEVAPTGGNGGGAIWDAVFGPDVEVYLTATVIPSSLKVFYLTWRVQDKNTYNNLYYCYISNSPTPGRMTFDLNKLVGGVDTALYVNHTYADTIQPGDQFGVSHIGDTISIYFKKAAGAWTLIRTVVDNDIATAGYIGMEITNSISIRADNFGGGTIPSGTPPLIIDSDFSVEGASGIGIEVSNTAYIYQSRGSGLGYDLQVNTASEARVDDVTLVNATQNIVGTLTSLRSDRAVWDTTNFSARHARDIDEATGLYHLINSATQTYTISNPSTDRAYDVTATTLNELAAVVGTLIADLRAKGLLA